MASEKKDSTLIRQVSVIVREGNWIPVFLLLIVGWLAAANWQLQEIIGILRQLSEELKR